jgi:uridine phosphorylase
MIPPSELLLTPDGRIYHLHLKPEQIADNVILVGDPGRVDTIANFFDEKEFRENNREFISITGYYKGVRITAMSTGIGIGNIDIALNELDALVNIDFKTREIKSDKRVLNLIRIGTSGALQADISLGTYILSKKAVGLDGLLNFLDARDAVCDLDFEAEFINAFPELNNVMHPYAVDGSDLLLKDLFGPETIEGITITAPGFYGSQGRVLRMEVTSPEFNDKLEKFRYKQQRITNYEMETSALFGYSKLLGHEAMTICLAIANRPRKEAMKEYSKQMNKLIEYTLDRITKD